MNLSTKRGTLDFSKLHEKEEEITTAELKTIKRFSEISLREDNRRNKAINGFTIDILKVSGRHFYCRSLLLETTTHS